MEFFGRTIPSPCKDENSRPRLETSPFAQEEPPERILTGFAQGVCAGIHVEESRPGHSTSMLLRLKDQRTTLRPHSGAFYSGLSPEGSTQGVVSGGFFPVFLTSVSVVIVVLPPGVVTVVSFFADSFSAQPTVPRHKLRVTAKVVKRLFMVSLRFRIETVLNEKNSVLSS